MELINAEATYYLKKTKLLISIPEKWSKNAPARDENGEAIDLTDPKARQINLPTAFCFACGILPDETTDDKAAFLARDALCDSIQSYFYSAGKHKSFVERYEKGNLINFFNDYESVNHSYVLIVIDNAIATLNKDNAGLWSGDKHENTAG